MKKKKNNGFIVVISVVLCCLVLAYAIYHIAVFSSNGVETEHAEKYTYNETVTADCLILRSETVLKNDRTGVISFNPEPGEKVAANSVIAEVFADEKSAQARNKITALKSKVKSLEQLQLSGEQLSVGAETIDMKIDQYYKTYLDIIDSGNLNGFENTAENLVAEINKKQIVTGSGISFAQRIAELKEQISTLEQSLGSYTEITAPESGYFIDTVDGYETVVPASGIDDMDFDKFKKAMDYTPSESGGIGKICLSNEWYIASAIAKDQAQHFEEGKEANLILPKVSPDQLKCWVYRVMESTSADEVLVIFKCTQMDYDLACARKETAEIVVNSYDGLRISSSGVRVIDGVKGVYIVDGNTAVFKNIEVLYTDSAFVICAYNSTSNSELKIYDDVIISGTGLYDGKVVK